MAEYKKMKLEDVFADIERIMGSELSDDEKSMTLRKKGAAAYENEGTYMCRPTACTQGRP